MRRLIAAILLPWLAFFAIRRSSGGYICLLRQMTLIGWVPASVLNTCLRRN